MLSFGRHYAACQALKTKCNLCESGYRPADTPLVESRMSSSIAMQQMSYKTSLSRHKSNANASLVGIIHTHQKILCEWKHWILHNVNAQHIYLTSSATVLAMIGTMPSSIRDLCKFVFEVARVQMTWIDVMLFILACPSRNSMHITSGAAKACDEIHY